MASSSAKDGYRILSIDGGGIRGFATLLILRAIMNAVSTKGERELKPCEYFHVIGGAGTGGVLALLLGRLKLSISDCMIEYWRLSSTIIRKEALGAEPPLFDATKLRSVMDDIVERHIRRRKRLEKHLEAEKRREAKKQSEQPESSKEEEEEKGEKEGEPEVESEPKDHWLIDFQQEDGNAKTCVFAVRVADGKRIPHCLRTYKRPSWVRDEDELKMSPATSITDAAVAAVAAEGLFEEATLTSANNEPVKFLDALYPLGLIDPTSLIIQEIQSLYYEPTQQLFSVGSGRVADNDIVDLLQLGNPTPPPSSTISSLYCWLHDALEKIWFSGERGEIESVTINSESWSPHKVIEHLKNQYKQLIQDIPAATLETYRRFDIAPLQGIIQDFPSEVPRRLDLEPVSEIGPNDFLSLREVKQATYKYLDLVDLPSSNSYLYRGEFEALCWATLTENDTVLAKLCPSAAGRQPWSDLRMLAYAENGKRLEDLNEWHCEKLLKYDPQLASKLISNIAERSLLHVAAQKGYIRLATSLLDSGAEIDKANGEGWTALRIGSFYKSNGVVELLLQRNADTEIKGNDGRTALHSAIEASGVETAKILLQYGANPNATDKTHVGALHIASHAGLEEMIKILLDHKANMEAKDDKEETVLHKAIHGFDGTPGKLATIDLLLDRGANTEVRNHHGKTALHLAVDRRDGPYKNLVELLLDRGAEIEAVDAEGRTALHDLVHACGRTHTYLPLVKLLLNRGAKADAADKSGRTVLHIAVSPSGEKRQRLVELLLDRGAKADAADNSGWTVLHAAASRYRKKRQRLVELLLDRGAKADAADNSGRTVLHVAASPSGEKRQRLVELLLDRGAKADAADNSGRTVLHVAASPSGTRRQRLVELLLDRGAKIEAVDAEGRTALHIAIGRRMGIDGRTDRRNVYEHGLMEGPWGYWRDRSEHFGEDSEMIKLLLERGVDVEVKDKNGWTALHIAASGGYSEIVKTLIDIGKANTEVRGNDGKSALDRALGLPDGPSKDETIKVLGGHTTGGDPS